MQSLIKNKQMLLHDRIIKDAKEIQYWDEQFKGEYWIHPNDYKTINLELIQRGDYSNSKKLTGEHTPIYIVICPDDPYKDSQVSMYRIHGRIGDGIHRYLSEKKNNQVWSHKYVKLNDFKEFMFLWLQSGSNKPEATAMRQREEKIKEYCNYVHDVIGINPKEKVSAFVIKELGDNHPFATSTLSPLIPIEFKNKIRQNAINKRWENNSKKKSKKDKKIEELENMINSYIRTIDELKIQAKSPDEKDLMIKDLESRNREYNAKILRLENQVKQLRKELKDLK